MVWLKLDDRFPDHPKLGLLEPSIRAYAFELHVTAMCYCARELTDGFIPQGQVGRLVDFSAHGLELSSLVAALVEVGLWEKASRGYVVHDFLDYNPSRDQVMAEKAKRSEAGAKGAAVRWGKDGTGHSASHGASDGDSDSPTIANGCPVPDPVPDALIPCAAPGERERGAVDALLEWDRSIYHFVNDKTGHHFADSQVDDFVSRHGERTVRIAALQIMNRGSSAEPIRRWPAYFNTLCNDLSADLGPGGALE